MADDEPSQQFTLRADAYHSFAAQPVQIDNLSQQVMTVNRQVGFTGSLNQPNVFKDDDIAGAVAGSHRLFTPNLK